MINVKSNDTPYKPEGYFANKTAGGVISSTQYARSDKVENQVQIQNLLGKEAEGLSARRISAKNQ